MYDLTSYPDYVYWILGLGVPIALFVVFALIYRRAFETDRDSLNATVEDGPQPHRPKDEGPARSLESALVQTRSSIFGRLRSVFSGDSSNAAMESVEEILYASDLGPKAVQRLLTAVQAQTSRDFETVRTALRDEMAGIFAAVKTTPLNIASHKPAVIMIVGVNGAGKTTTIGKLSSRIASQGKRVLVAAGDTFRAAAGEQLRVWTDRAQVEIFSPPGVQDPSAVAFDACQTAKANGFDVLIIDTAGRLHTQKNLMEELKKMKRVVNKAIPGAPHETLLVLDANSGQNALQQAREFHSALEVTGVVLTKLDGTAKGGVALGLTCELGIPIKLIGVGEGVADLREFSSSEFVASII